MKISYENCIALMLIFSLDIEHMSHALCPWNTYAFGCVKSESSCHNYKILRVSSYYENSERYVFNFEIYELSSDSWRVLDGVTDKWRLHHSDDVVSLKGNAYWMHKDREAGHNVLLSFDFTAEVFVSFPLPDQSDDDRRDLAMSVVREEHLAVLHHNTGTFLTEMNVWLSNKIDEAKEVSWSKFLVVSFHNFKYPRYPKEMNFWVDDENKVVVTCVRDITIVITFTLLERIYINMFMRLQMILGFGHVSSVMFQVCVTSPRQKKNKAEPST